MDENCSVRWPKKLAPATQVRAIDSWIIAPAVATFLGENPYLEDICLSLFLFLYFLTKKEDYVDQKVGPMQRKEAQHKL